MTRPKTTRLMKRTSSSVVITKRVEDMLPAGLGAEYARCRAEALRTGGTRKGILAEAPSPPSAPRGGSGLGPCNEHMKSAGRSYDKRRRSSTARTGASAPRASARSARALC